jgi:hypothetical protein
MTIDMNSILDQMAEQNKIITRNNAFNKEALFNTLATTTITQITVAFDGDGDSGQIEDVTAYAGEEVIELPSTPVSLRHTAWGKAEPEEVTEPLREAVERLCYDYLSQEHDGWENNDGASGEFTFDVAERTIELECNVRFTDSSSFNHLF